jgi:hypothetical protein
MFCELPKIDRPVIVTVDSMMSNTDSKQSRSGCAALFYRYTLVALEMHLVIDRNESKQLFESIVTPALMSRQRRLIISTEIYIFSYFHTFVPPPRETEAN